MKTAARFARENPLIAGAVVAALIGGAWLAARGAQQAGRDVGGAVVGAANGLIGGVVEGLGGLFGLPSTDLVKGNAAVDAGDWLGASAYLPAPAFIGAASQNAATAIVAAANDPAINPLQPLGSWLGGQIFDLTH